MAPSEISGFIFEYKIRREMGAFSLLLFVTFFQLYCITLHLKMQIATWRNSHVVSCNIRWRWLFLFLRKGRPLKGQTSQSFLRFSNTARSNKLSISMTWIWGANNDHFRSDWPRFLRASYLVALTAWCATSGLSETHSRSLTFSELVIRCILMSEVIFSSHTTLSMEAN